jgi:hypothetical protein
MFYMDNHPIPQDVTGFQFKLVGNMTIKQFGYVGSGILISVVFYYLPIPWFIKFPAVGFFTLTGLSLAFLPIEGRPMDLMATNFVKAVLHPNQFIYHKMGGKLSFTDLNLEAVVTPTAAQLANRKPTIVDKNKQEKLRAFLDDMSSQPSSELDQKESQFLNAVFNQTAGQQAYVNPPIQPPAQPQVQLPVDQPATAAVPQVTFEPAELQPPTPISQSTPPIQPAAPEPVIQPAPVPAPAPTETAPQGSVRQINQDQAVAAGVPDLPTFPNLISGIVKDSRGNVLIGILVEVKNKDGDSVRAFKTNALGQFTSATQLGNGVYTIVFEDPKGLHRFQTIQVEANGSVLPPLEVISMDEREELRKALFG